MTHDELVRLCESLSQRSDVEGGVDRDPTQFVNRLRQQLDALQRLLTSERGDEAGPREDVAHLLSELLSELVGLSVHLGVDLVGTLKTGNVGVPGRGSTEWPNVLGVDGCKEGWVGVRLGAGPPMAFTAATIGQLVAVAGPGLECVGIDIPIGLPDSGRRGAEGAARAILPGRSSTVFSTLVRAAYEADSYADAVSIQIASTGRSLSKQSWALKPKILEVDDFIRSPDRPPLVEVHPEVSFAVLTGTAMQTRKKTPEGQRARRTALRDAGIEPPERPRGGVGEDDLLDACVVAWTAARVVRGEARSHPEVPETFSDGWPAAIWA